MLKRLLAVFTAMLLTLATYAYAAELVQDHPSTYTVRKGDTLWDISARFLRRPWLWPEIWQANPQVKNPHLIYPGDVLSLVYINGQPTMQLQSMGPHVGLAISAIPLAQVEPFLKKLAIVDDVHHMPYVLGLEDDRELASSGQLVYVRGMAEAHPGQLVQFVRPIHRYTRDRDSIHSTSLDFRGDKVHRDFDPEDQAWHELWTDYTRGERNGYAGTEIMVQSSGQVTHVQGEIATVLLQGEERDVRVGDRVMPLDPQPYDLQFFPQPPTAPIYPDARVLASADGLYGAGPNFVVALSIGSSDGVKNGTTFSIWHEGAVRPDTVVHRNMLQAKADSVKMPDEFVGHVMIFRTFDKVSYGLIMDGIKPALVGDRLKHPDATE
jgi:hypothetical protein